MELSIVIDVSTLFSEDVSRSSRSTRAFVGDRLMAEEVAVAWVPGY